MHYSLSLCVPVVIHTGVKDQQGLVGCQVCTLNVCLCVVSVCVRVCGGGGGGGGCLCV